MVNAQYETSQSKHNLCKPMRCHSITWLPTTPQNKTSIVGRSCEGLGMYSGCLEMLVEVLGMSLGHAGEIFQWISAGCLEDFREMTGGESYMFKASYKSL